MSLREALAEPQEPWACAGPQSLWVRTGRPGFTVWAGWPSDAAPPGVCRGGSSFQLMAILSHRSGLTTEGHLLCNQHSLKLGLSPPEGDLGGPAQRPPSGTITMLSLARSHLSGQMLTSYFYVLYLWGTL